MKKTDTLSQTIPTSFTETTYVCFVCSTVCNDKSVNCPEHDGLNTAPPDGGLHTLYCRSSVITWDDYNITCLPLQTKFSLS